MSAPRRALAVVAAAALAATGCAYFNGMYYANRYTRLAEASERAGRTSEARDRWVQAWMHAESLLARHPRSRWAPDAQLVRGRALFHLEAYSDAVTALEAAARDEASSARRLEALGLIGHAYVALRMYDDALPALDSATAAPQPAVRDQAFLDRGRLQVARDRPDLARADLARSGDPRAPFALAQVDLQLGDTAAAGALYDSLAGVKEYPDEEWRAGLDSLAAAGATEHADRLAERLVARPGLSPGAMARLMLDDATRRLAAADTEGATVEFGRVVAVARDSLAGQTAAVTLCRLRIAAATDDSALARERTALELLGRAGGATARDTRETLRLIARLDTLAAAPVAPDAFWLLRAELLRDSLHAGRLAAAAFAHMADAFPASPWTPKGLVAALAAGYPAADSLRAVLTQRYASSPYVVAALGGGGGAGDTSLVVLEDSLRSVLAVRAAVRPGAVAPRAPGEIGDVDDDPGARRRPRPPTPRPVPQPAGPPQAEPPR